MGGSVAGQGASASGTLGGIGDAAVGRGDIKRIEIDQVRLGLNAVRVVAGDASGLVIAHVLAVEPVAHQQRLAVAFVAQSVGGGAFSLEIS